MQLPSHYCSAHASFSTSRRSMPSPLRSLLLASFHCRSTCYSPVHAIILLCSRHRLHILEAALLQISCHLVVRLHPTSSPQFAAIRQITAPKHSPLQLHRTRSALVAIRQRLLPPQDNTHCLSRNVRATWKFVDCLGGTFGLSLLITR